MLNTVQPIQITGIVMNRTDNVSPHAVEWYICTKTINILGICSSYILLRHVYFPWCYQSGLVELQMHNHHVLTAQVHAQLILNLQIKATIGNIDFAATVSTGDIVKSKIDNHNCPYSTSDLHGLSLINLNPNSKYSRSVKFLYFKYC